MTTKTFFPLSALILLVLGFSSCKEDVKDFGGATAEALNETFGTGFADEVLRDVSIDKNGNIYVSSKTKIYKLDANGVATVFAGSNTSAVTDGKGTAASFRNIDLMSFDDAGNIYVIDFQFIRKVSPNGTVISLQITKPGSYLFKNYDEMTVPPAPPVFTGIFVKGNAMFVSIGPVVFKVIGNRFTEFAGGGGQGFVDGQGRKARFSQTHAIVPNISGEAMIVSDGGSLRKILIADSIVTTITGSDKFGMKDGNLNEASYQTINDFVIDKNGVYYLSSFNTVRKISADGQVSTIAGPIKSDGSAFQAGGIAIDLSNKYLYITDLNKKATLIRIDLTK